MQNESGTVLQKTHTDWLIQWSMTISLVASNVKQKLKLSIPTKMNSIRTQKYISMFYFFFRNFEMKNMTEL